MSTPLTARLIEEYASASQALPSSGAAADRRNAAIEVLRAQGLPTSRDENWKYANLRVLERLRFAPAAGAATATRVSVSAADMPPALPDFARYVYVDGVLSATLSAPAATGAATVTPLASTPAVAGAATPALKADERFAAVNAAFATDGTAIRVTAGSGAATPAGIELVFVASADAQAGASYPRVAVRLEAGARLTLIERHLSAGSDNSFVNSAVTADLARGATLQHYRLQDLAGRAIMFDTLSATLGADASYHLHGISTGAQAARSTLTVRLAGERANLAMAMAALGDRAQVNDMFALVEHLAPGARTTQTFRGISAGRARVAFNGKIVVARNAAGTDSQQSLRGLLAGAEAEIDVRPQLEIYTDDVRCSHGATVGKLDDNMLFYLLSRGLDRDTAQRLLKWAFLAEVVTKISVPALRREIEAHLPGALKDATLQELL
ncbi:MAG: Fe-S cluster assembly protein SufD [Steroidobacterales bacterium]